jgi:hypothetical protein
VTAPATAPNGARQAAGLVAYTYENDEIQARADELVPIGWCNQCAAAASHAKANGLPAAPVHAGVTMVPLPQQVAIPGAGTQIVVIAAPVCLARHLVTKKNSPLAVM